MFETEAASEKEFSNWSELQTWVDEEEKSTSRISIQGLLKKGADFHEDKYFGSSDYKLRFTENGLKALCYKIGFPLVALEMTKESELASRILNDLLSQDNAKEQLSNSEFVINEADSNSSHGKVCGIVSSSYVGYSNKSFIQDIEKIVGKNDLSTAGKLSFKEAYSINTKTHIRLTSTHISGTVFGRGGISADKTEIGLEFCNSMVGDAAVSIDYFLHRLVCANGLVLPAGRNEARVIHSGKANNFSSRLDKAFRDVFSGLGEKATYVNQLSDIDFSPKRLAELELSKIIFDIIPKSKSTVIDMYRHVFNDFIFKKLNSEEKLKREELAIEYLPHCFAGKLSKAVFNSKFRDNASMFDLINVFTEHAKEKSPSEKVEIQRKSGQLADWVINNKIKFQ